MRNNIKYVRDKQDPKSMSLFPTSFPCRGLSIIEKIYNQIIFMALSFYRVLLNNVMGPYGKIT